MTDQASIPQCTSRARSCPDTKRPTTFWPKPVREGRLAHCRSSAKGYSPGTGEYPQMYLDCYASARALFFLAARASVSYD
jgi:hypothetical protein